MGTMLVRNLPDEVHQRLREQAATNGRSLEAEVRSILIQSTVAASAGGVGQRLRDRFGLVLGDEMTIVRDQAASEPSLFD